MRLNLPFGWKALRKPQVLLAICAFSTSWAGLFLHARDCARAMVPDTYEEHSAPACGALAIKWGKESHYRPGVVLCHFFVPHWALSFSVVLCWCCPLAKRNMSAPIHTWQPLGDKKTFFSIALPYKQQFPFPEVWTKYSLGLSGPTWDPCPFLIQSQKLRDNMGWLI